MKNPFLFFLALALLSPLSSPAQAPTQNQNSDGTVHYLETLGLAKPLLLMIAPKGFIACGYIDVEACNKTNEACAIVVGVSNKEDMKKAEIKKVSEAALKLGIKVGMTGGEALKLLSADSYHVGFRDFDFTISNTSVMHARVWYPIDASIAETAIPTASFLSPFSGSKNSPIITSPNPLPLLLISHGSGAVVERLDWIADAFARKGWVVAGFNHRSNTFNDNSALGLLKVWNRAKDTSQFLSYLLKDDAVASRIDRSRISILGHSAGGTEVLLLAGARFSKDKFTNPLPLCEPPKNPDLDDERCSELKKIDVSKISPSEIEGDYSDSRITHFIGLDPGFAHSFDPKIKPKQQTAIFTADKLKRPSGQVYSKDFKDLFPEVRFMTIPESIHISFISPCNETGIKQKIPLCVGDKNRKELQNQVIQEVERFLKI